MTRLLFLFSMLLTAIACSSSREPVVATDGGEVVADGEVGCGDAAPPPCLDWSGGCCTPGSDATCVDGAYSCPAGSTPGTASEIASCLGCGGTIECGDATCGADEYCVMPCCGGALPMCVDPNPDGTCPVGTAEGMCSDGGSFMTGCTTTCEPPPPFCVPRSTCDEMTCPPAGDTCSGGSFDAATRTYSCACA